MKKIEVDATNESLGRLSSKIAVFLRGKHIASYQPNILPQVEVSVKNLKKIKFTGKKLQNKIYYRYSGNNSGIKAQPFKKKGTKTPAVVTGISVVDFILQLFAGEFN